MQALALITALTCFASSTGAQVCHDRGGWQVEIIPVPRFIVVPKPKAKPSLAIPEVHIFAPVCVGSEEFKCE